MLFDVTTRGSSRLCKRLGLHLQQEMANISNLCTSYHGMSWLAHSDLQKSLMFSEASAIRGALSSVSLSTRTLQLSSDQTS